LMETEVADLIGADRHERTPQRTGHRNGYRMRTWDTRVARLSWRSRRCGLGPIFPRCCSPAGARSTRCSRSSKRRMCMASRRGRSTS
jgi:hypothetical protein